MKFIKDFIKEVKNYVTFIKNMIIKFPLIFLGTITLSVALYLYTLNLFAYAGLFRVSKSFFVEDSIELKLWISLFSFTYIFFSKSVLSIIIFLMLLVFILPFPFYIINILEQSTNLTNSRHKTDLNTKSKLLLNKSWYKSCLDVLNFLCSSLVVLMAKLFAPVFSLTFVIYLFYLMSGASIVTLQKHYIEHSSYCQIVNHESNPHELIIVENPSVPYKLIFTESQITYFQPNQARVPWKEYNESEINDMRELCNKK